MHTAWPDEPAVVVLCGVHHWAAEQVRKHARDGGTVIAVDDCDVTEFADLAGPVPGELLVARLAGGPYSRVVTAFAGLAGALAKRPRLRGAPLLVAVRGEVAGPHTGWQVASVPPRPRTDGFDVAVVGGGVVGRAAAAELAEAGAHVALFDPGGARTAASSVSGALIRAFEPDERSRRLALRAYQVLWGRPELAALHGFRRTGSLVLLGPEHLDEAVAGVAQLRDDGVEVSLLSTSELAGKWPGLRVDGLAGAVWEPGGGYAAPAVTLAALVDRARQAGVAVFRRTVQSLADAGSLADRVLVAAGCATPEILGDAWPGDRPARTRRIRYAILDAGGERLPTIVDLTPGLWGRPDGADGFRAGMPVDEWDVPVVAGTGLEDNQLMPLRAGLTARLPGLASAEVLTARFGTDLYVAGGPLLGSLPGAPHIWVAAGWSGGGFKTAPGAARRLAETERGVRDVQR
jgi:glycine/D-amino acid oxidase-like deaminating enzyme